MNTFKRSSNYLLIGSLMFFALQAEVLAENTRPVVKDNVSTLLKTKSCSGCDLAGANLNRLDLSGTDLSGADLSEAKLYLTNLANANLREANLHNAVLGGADLAGADLRGADLRGAKLSGAYLVGAIRDEEAQQVSEGEIKIDAMQQPTEKTENQGVLISERRDYEESPPVVNGKKEVTESPDIAEIHTSSKMMVTDDEIIQQPSVQLDSSSAKTVKPIKEAVVKEEALQSIDVAADDVSGKVKEDNSISEPEPLIEEYIASSEPVDKQTVPDVRAKSVEDTLAVDNYEQVEPVSLSDTTPVVSNEVNNTSENIEENYIPEGMVSTEKDLEGTEESGKNDPVTEKVAEDSSRKERVVEQLLDTNRCYGCNLAGVDLSGKDLDEADLEAADLTGSNLEDVDFQGANLKGAVLHDANLRNADLSGADLYKADLSGADLSGADLGEAKLDEAQIAGAIGVQMDSIMGVE